MHRTFLSHIPWLLSFFVGTPAAILLAFLILNRTAPAQTTVAPQVLGAATASDLYVPSLSPQIITADARPIIIRNYLQRYGSPLEPYSRLIVQISDKYSLDYRLLVAIAQQESNLCKKIPLGSYNCWGFGIYGNITTRFSNYPQAIETVAKTLKHNYIDLGLVTPQEIMAKYTPPSLDKGGPWAKAVSQFLSDLE